MKLITHKDITNMGISPKECFEWVSDIIAHKNDTVLPHKISMKHQALDGVFCNVMPSFVEVDGKLYGGVKIVTRYPNRKPSLDSMLLLFDGVTGENLALMDANWITAMRTGAVAAHSVDLFAKKDASVYGMMGLGNVARATMAVLADIYSDKKLDVKLLKHNNSEVEFINRFADCKNITFTCVDTAQEMVDNSDVVISAATYLPNNVCEDEYFKEGVLVVPVHTLGFTNCDLFFDKVFADDTSHVEGFRYFDKFKSFSEVSDVVNGINKGRENDNERILAYNIGISIHDISFAARIFNKIDRNSLPELDMDSPVEKYWI